MSETWTHSSALALQTLWEGGICSTWSIMCGPLMSALSFPAVPWYTCSALARTLNSCWHGGVTAWQGLVAVLPWVPWRLSPGLRAQHPKAWSYRAVRVSYRTQDTSLSAQPGKFIPILCSGLFLFWLHWSSSLRVFWYHFPDTDLIFCFFGEMWIRAVSVSSPYTQIHQCPQKFAGGSVLTSDLYHIFTMLIF